MSREDEAIGTDVEAAGRLISACISRDITANFDLEESLEASRYASHPYSSHPKEWPPLAEVVDTRELPAVLIERYNTAGGEGTALCGIFPEICRAWASVDNSLFLWRFDKWDGQCPEYSGEEEAICAVGLVKSRPGIFVEAIQYLLVLATPLEVILLGVCCRGRGDGTDPYAELSLQPLPEYTVPSGGVTMTCITCTNNGRVFLAGRDGHIYEMQYSSGSGWHKRCRIVCLTGGVWSNISRWVSSTGFNFGAVDPIVGMVIDNNRYILYARTQASKIQVFDLGVNGDGSPKKIAEERNLIDHRDAQYGSGRFASSRPVSRAAKPSVVCIIPISPLESKWLHIIAVLSDGRRMYLSTAPSGGNNNSVGALTGLGSTLRRPCTLKLVTTRAPPSVGVGGGITFGALSVGGRSQSDDLALKIETAYYSAGVLFLSDSSPTTVSSLLIVNMDLTTSSSLSSNFGMSARTPALRESVSSLPVEGRTLCVDDILPLPELAAAVQSLYSDSFGIETLNESCEKACVELRARGELVIQHILPRRRVVVFSTMGVMEIVFNRPVDILRRLLESSSPRSLLEEFFNRFGAGEAAAMCLMLAAKLVSVEETLVSNTVAEKAAESFEDPRLVGTPQVGGSGALSNTITPPGVGFNMGMVVQEAEPVFSGAHEGLCLCSSRLLFPVWEQPVFVIKGKAGDEVGSEGVIVCRLSIEAMQVLESKVRSLEQFLRSRRDQRRGLYGRIAGLGDVTGSILYGSVSDIGIGERSVGRNLFGIYGRNIDSGNGTSSSKRQRLPYSLPELAAMEVRAMECVRRLLRRSGEALFLLQLLSQHHVTRLIQRLDIDLRHKLVNLTFQQLVCSEEGDQLAMSLISGLVEYYVGPEGRGTVDDISARLRGGCPSYYNDNDYKFFQAVDCLEKAAVTIDPEEKEKLAREAFSLLTKVPESADLRTVCKRFEDLRFYEAVVRLPLQKAQALDPEGDALNDQIDVSRRENALALRMQCYEIVTDVLRSLNGEARQNAPQREFKTSTRISGSQPALDQASRKRYIRQIVQLSVQWPDRVFREHLYRTMIDIGLENELLEFGGSDLVPFLLSATQEPISQVGAVSAITSTVPITSRHVKYLELLAGYYVTKRQHVLAAHLLLRLAERRSTDEGGNITLKQRHEYLSKAVIQAKNASNINGAVGSGQGAFDNGLLELLEGKLSVLYFQIKIKEQLEFLASSLEDSVSAPPNEIHPGDPFPPRNLMSDANLARNARDKGREISLDLKSITQLYNEYAVPFELWEICLEVLHFADHAGDADSSIIRETWARLLDQALSRGGIAEACSVLKRVGSQLYPGEGASLPLDTICLHLEKATLERSISGAELVGDEDVARALIAACKGATEPLLATYDQLLSNRAILASSDLRLRLLRSVLVILREWSMSLLAQRMGTSPAGVSLILGGALALEQTPVLNQGVRDKIASASNRYMTEVRRLALPQSQTAGVYEGFRELEKTLLVPFSF